MALPTLNWKKIGPHSTGGVNTCEAMLDAFDDMFTNDDYYDATTRTPGSGSAWTHAIYENATVTEALYLTPPAAAVSDFRVIIAGVDSGTPTPTMNEDVFATGKLMGGMNKEGGSFNAWDNALPFTSGTFSGYNNWLDPDQSATTIDYVWALESQEAIVLIAEKSDGTIKAFMVGALFDPNSAVHKDAEASGRVYSMINSAFSSSIALNWDSDSFLVGDNSTDDLHHHRTWVPGSAIMGRCGTYYANSKGWTYELTLPSGKAILDPIIGRFFSGTTFSIGTLRQIHWAFNKSAMTTVQSGGSDFGHYLGSDTDTPSDALLFLA